MNPKVMYFGLILLVGSVKAVKPVEKEVYFSLNGQKILFKKEGKQSIEVDGKNIDVEMKFGEYLTFDNYGITFQLPHKASAYIDESSQDFDIWNVDYYDSMLLLFVIKNSQMKITDELLMSQLKKITADMGMIISEPKYEKEENTGMNILSVVGTLGQFEFMVEQFGFVNDSHSFLLFTYKPLIDRKLRKVDEVYQQFKSVFFNSLIR